MQPLYPHKFLELMAVPGHSGVYLLGSFARHVTIYSQQIRAVNMVDALCRTGQLGAGTRVIVVGGGVAGLTAGAASLVRGAKVTVIEQGSGLCPIQSEAGEQYLHPHIYDWPLVEPNNGEADLPVLAWKAGEAKAVFEGFRQNWEALASRLKADWVVGHPVKDIQSDGGLHRIIPEATLRSGEKVPPADIVILAVGFGRERSRGDYQTYWQSAPIDSEQQTRLKWLVSGFGDGALTDLMRLCVHHFRHSAFVESFAGDRDLAEQLRNFLAAPSGTVEKTFNQNLYPLVQGRLSMELRTDTEVVLNAPDDYLESSRSSILNRFIVFHLTKLGAFRRLPGKMIVEPEIPPFVNGKYHVRFENPASAEDFDRLVIRHGPRPALNKDDIPALHTACGMLEGKWDDLRKSGAPDRTRIPLFDAADYSIEKAAGSQQEPKNRESVSAGPFPRYVVLESSRRRNPQTLSWLVETAVSGSTYRRDMEAVIGKMPPEDPPVQAIGINEALATQSGYNNSVRTLCCAEIAVVDVTDFEPGIMLLLGIRTIARRGVTIIVTNEEIELSKWSELPFDLKELYPVATNDAIKLGQLISRAWGQYKSMPHYQDLPAWEAARQTGRDYAPVEPERSILWLCPFGKEYSAQGHEGYLRGVIADKFAPGSALERVTDIVSPQLLAQRLYSAIRFRKLCIIDWTFWSPNVFFEFGVRLAINRFGPVCLLASSTGGGPVPEGIPEQRAHLEKLFAPIRYVSMEKAGSLFAEIKSRYEDMKNAESPRGRSAISPAFGALPYHHTYNRVAEFLDLRLEPGGIEPQEFLNGVLVALTGESVSKPGSPVLFANDSRAFAAQVTRTAIAIGIAGWLYMNHRYDKSDLRRDDGLLKQYTQLGDRLLDLLRRSPEPKDLDLADSVEKDLDSLKPPDGTGRGNENGA